MNHVMRYKVRSKLLGFTVSIEEHGAYAIGAENVIIRPERPLNGHDVFISTNGRAFFTGKGEILALKDAGLIVFINLEDDSTFHMEPPEGWLFARVWYEDQMIHVDLYKHDDSEAADSLPSFSPNDIPTKLVEGWGSAENGLFPTAYFDFVRLYNQSPEDMV